MTEAVPLRPDLFRETPEGPTLLAVRCKSCGQVVFPARDLCLACRSGELTMIELGSDGELLCATTVHMPTQATRPGDAVGYVIMPPGVRVFTQIDKRGDALPEPGTRMKLRIAPLRTDGDTEVLAYRFAPAEEVTADA